MNFNPLHFLNELIQYGIFEDKINMIYYIKRMYHVNHIGEHHLNYNPKYLDPEIYIYNNIPEDEIYLQLYNNVILVFKFDDNDELIKITRHLHSDIIDESLFYFLDKHLGYILSPKTVNWTKLRKLDENEFNFIVRYLPKTFELDYAFFHEYNRIEDIFYYDFIKVDSSLERYLTLRGISYLNKLLSNLNKVNIGNIEVYQLLKKIINEYYNNNGNKKNKPL